MPEPTEIELITMFDKELVTDFLKNLKDKEVINPEYVGPRILNGKGKIELLFPIKDDDEKDTGYYDKDNKLINSSNFRYLANRVYELISSKKSPTHPNWMTKQKGDFDNNNLFQSRQKIKTKYQEATKNSKKELTVDQEKELLALELKLLIKALSDEKKIKLDHKGEWEHEERNELDSQNGGKSKTRRVKKSKKSRKSKRKSKRRTRKH
jgi:hypothetical protein